MDIFISDTLEFIYLSILSENLLEYVINAP